MDEMEFTEAESNMNDLISEYQQYQVKIKDIDSARIAVKVLLKILFFFLFFFNCHKQEATVDEEVDYDEEGEQHLNGDVEYETNHH